jgi:hypothetical protein
MTYSDVGCLFVSVQTFVDPVDMENTFRIKSAFTNSHLHRNNALLTILVCVAAGTCLNFVASRFLTVDYSGFRRHVTICSLETLFFVNTPPHSNLAPYIAFNISR